MKCGRARSWAIGRFRTTIQHEQPCHNAAVAQLNERRHCEGRRAAARGVHGDDAVYEKHTICVGCVGCVDCVGCKVCVCLVKMRLAHVVDVPAKIQRRVGWIHLDDGSVALHEGLDVSRWEGLLVAVGAHAHGLAQQHGRVLRKQTAHNFHLCA